MSRKLTLIRYPKITLVTRSSVDVDAINSFLMIEGLPLIDKSIIGVNSSDIITELAARLCYNSYGRGRKDISDFITNLLQSKDGSVFEHVSYGFMVCGVSRSLTHEWVRHRAGFAYSQRSQRYVNESEGGVVIPPLLQEPGMEQARDRFIEEVCQSLEAYDSLVAELTESLEVDRAKGHAEVRARRKSVRQTARSVLPNAMETKMYVTANVRAWRHFIEMRGSVYADAEIRRVALKILEILQRESPLLFGDFEQYVKDGVRCVAPRYSKV